MLGVVGAGTGDDGDPACHLLDGEFDNLLLLFKFDGDVFAGGTHNHDGVDSVFNLEIQEAVQSLVVDGVSGHGGDNGGSHAGKDGFFHSNLLYLLKRLK